MATPGSRQQQPVSLRDHAALRHGAGTSPLQLEGGSTIPRAKTKPRLIKSSRGEQGRAISRASLLGKQKSLHHNGSSSLRRDNPIYTAGTSPSVTSLAQMPPLGFFSPFRAYRGCSEGRKCYEGKTLRGRCSKLHVPRDAPCSQAREEPLLCTVHSARCLHVEVSQAAWACWGLTVGFSLLGRAGCWVALGCTGCSFHSAGSDSSWRRAAVRMVPAHQEPCPQVLSVPLATKPRCGRAPGPRAPAALSPAASPARGRAPSSLLPLPSPAFSTTLVS